MKRSNLRGRGGAGFATGLKWEAARNAPGAERYIVCNADEGEPGSVQGSRAADFACRPQFSREWRSPAYAVGATRGFLYLRGEYEYLKPRLDAELERMRLVRRLGPAIRGCAGFDFDVEIHVGAGAYVCGEETALAGIACGQARTPARPSAVPGHPRLSRPTDGGQQRRDALPGDRSRHSRRRGVRGARHQEFDRLEASLRLRRLRAAGCLRVFLRRADRAGAGRRRRARATSRRCRSAVRPAC